MGWPEPVDGMFSRDMFAEGEIFVGDRITSSANLLRETSWVHQGQVATVLKTDGHRIVVQFHGREDTISYPVKLALPWKWFKLKEVSNVVFPKPPSSGFYPFDFF